MRRTRPLAERFWEKVNFDGPVAAHMDTPCWLWTAVASTGRGGKSYGRIGIGGRAGGMRYAHRVAYELAYGVDPGALDVDHVCHTTFCVRPDHLRLATNKQNQENKTGANRNSRSGVRGVSWCFRSNKWRATVQHNGTQFSCGYFESKADAERAARLKRNELFTHNSLDVSA